MKKFKSRRFYIDFFLHGTFCLYYIHFIYSFIRQVRVIDRNFGYDLKKQRSRVTVEIGTIYKPHRYSRKRHAYIGLDSYLLTMVTPQYWWKILKWKIQQHTNIIYSLLLYSFVMIWVIKYETNKDSRWNLQVEKSHSNTPDTKVVQVYDMYTFCWSYVKRSFSPINWFKRTCWLNFFWVFFPFLFQMIFSMNVYAIW